VTSQVGATSADANSAPEARGSTQFVARRLAAGRCFVVLVLVDTVAFVVLVVDTKKMDWHR
jgi:hypothetical protein